MDLTTLFSTFGLLFVAELGDKTQLAVITQVCKYRRPWCVFLGGSLALAAITGLGVAFGRLLSALVPEVTMRRVAAGAFVVMGLFVFCELARRRHEPDEVTCEKAFTSATQGRRLEWVAFYSTFGLLFLAEMGDKTQLAALSMASKASSPWAVFLGAALALAAVTGLGVVFGQGLARLVPERVLKLISAIAFVALGILIWFNVF